MSAQTYPDDHTEKIEKLVTMTVAAAKGIVPLGQVLLPLSQIANGNLAPPEIIEFTKALLRILRGERDALALAESLTPEYTEVIWKTLDQIDAPLPAPAPNEWVGLTFEQLVEKVAAACSGEVLLWQQLWTLTGQLAADPSLPPEIQYLGAVLQKILAGERQSFVLAELAPEHRGAIEHLLEWLNTQAVTPAAPPNLCYPKTNSKGDNQ
jgi:hypothetical protein